MFEQGHNPFTEIYDPHLRNSDMPGPHSASGIGAAALYGEVAKSFGIGAADLYG